MFLLLFFFPREATSVTSSLLLLDDEYSLSKLGSTCKGKNLLLEAKVQSTLVISTSVISNNLLSRRKNLVLVITQKSKIRL